MTERYLAVLSTSPGCPTQLEISAIPSDALVLTDQPNIAAQLSNSSRRHAPFVVCTVPTATGIVHLGPARENSLDTLLAAHQRDTGSHEPLRHVRAVTDLRTTPWPHAPSPALLTLQELLFLAARHLANTSPPDSSLAVLVHDHFRHGTPHPHASLLTGFVTCASWELPSTRVYATVTDTDRSSTALSQLASESRIQAGLPVGYYRGETRSAEHIIPAPLISAPPPESTMLGDESVIVAAGGGRGITATVLSGLVRHARPWIWLLGSTPLDALADEARALSSTGRADYLRERIAASPELAITDASARWDRLRNAQEVLRTCSALRQQCGNHRVRYITCDVTDPIATLAAAERVYRTSGRVDMLLHGAGVSGARALLTKSLRTFRWVRSVKLDGYHNLKCAFAAPPPTMWCSFSSIAGVIGLPGECDYSPANDTLNAAARRERGQGRDERAIAWTMWGESGLGPRSGFTDHTRNTGRLSLLSDTEGQRLFNAELTAPSAGAQAVPLYLGPPEEDLIAEHYQHLLPKQSAFAPLGTHVSPLEDGNTSWSWLIDLDSYAYLRGHCRKATAILPGAAAIELAVECADRLHPGSTARRITDVRFSAPIELARHQGRYALHASTVGDDGELVVHVEIRGHPQPSVSGSSHPRPYFSADVVLGEPCCSHPSDLPNSATPSAPHILEGTEARFTHPFDGVHSLRQDGRGVSALCHLNIAGQDAEHFSKMAICWLTLDATLQVASFVEPGRLATPASIGALYLHTDQNDLSLAAEATDLSLTATPDRRHAAAISTARHRPKVLLVVENLHLT
ncbi:SDR family NAD(P)-dependent oxidoreductase [Streptomyces microflavus]|uniref:SDR family NAD(P)-dependent oxidoreductase n=1 Tax=Streptomyces microflavus TaxID=1919 RepID=UPI00379A96E2